MLFYNTVLLLSCTVWWISLVDREGTAWKFEQPLLMGLLTGLALWTTPQSILLLLPILAVFSIRRLRQPGDLYASLSFVALMVPAVIVGLVPWLYRNVKTGFASLNTGPDAEPYWRRVLISARGLIFQPFGDLPHEVNELLPAFGLTLVLGVVFVALIVPGIRRDVDRVSLAILIVFPFLAAVNPLSGIPAAQVRYAFVAWPALILLAGAVLARPSLRSAALVVVLVASIVVGWDRQVPYWYREDHTAVSALTDALRTVHADGVLASYWDAYKLQYMCSDCPRLIPFVVIRDTPADAPRPSNVSYILASPYAPANQVSSELRRRGIDFESRVLPSPGYVLIYTASPVPVTLFANWEFGG
jgi:hypothetical protein